MIVLDTHALIWWAVGDERLSVNAGEAIRRELEDGGQVLVSAITAWEIAMLVERGRLVLTMELGQWLSAVESIEGVALVPITPQLAMQSVQLPGEFHRDPADRMIVALAREFNAAVITADDKIRRYAHVKSVW